MKKGDFFIIAGGIIIALICIIMLYIPNSKGDTVIITVNGKIYAEKPLKENCEININGTNTVAIENGEVYMKSANCKDKLCINQGKIHNSSKSIICLPNKVVVSIKKGSSAKKDEPDQAIDTVVR